MLTVERSDEVLAREAARGDGKAFEALVRRHTAPLLAFCRRLTRDAGAAEDAAQEAFIKAYRNLQRFDSSRSFASWITRIAQNVCIDGFRAEPAQPARAPERMSRPLIRPEDACLEKAVAGLSVKQQSVLHYKYRLGLNAAEIARQIGTTHEDVRICLHRAILLLREKLSP